MSVRTRPAVRERRAPWNRPERRTFLINAGFALVVVLAVGVLALAVGVSWYNQNLAPVAAVNGENITQDDLRRRLQVEQVRLAIAQGRIHDEFNARRISEAERDAQLQFLRQRAQQMGVIALERLIDARIQFDLARQEGIEITPADIEAKITEEATRPEQRRAWVIEVAPKVEAEQDEPTDEATAVAKAAAEKAHRELRAGRDWAEVAKEVSTHSTRSSAGDLGWVTEGFDSHEAFNDAVFALEAGGITDVIVDDEGVYRIGRVTEIVPKTVDPHYRALVADQGVPLSVYEEAVRQDVVGEKLRERIESQALAEGPQRRVAEIYLENRALPEELPEGSVKVRHILYSPKDDPGGAENLPDDDPAWKAAEDEAREAYEALRADPESFDAMAREESDEGSADITGGKLPWFDPGMVASGELDGDFGGAIFREGLQPLQLLEPVRSAFGWHVIQVLYYPTDEEHARRLKEQIEAGTLTFAEAARDYSAAEEAADGGEVGWVARFQVDQQSEQAIFDTPVGGLTDPVVVDGDGVHLYQVLEEAVRTPEGEQRRELEQTAFSNWYEAKKTGYAIDRNPGFRLW